MSGASRWRLVANYAGLLGVLVVLTALFGTQKSDPVEARAAARFALSERPTPDQPLAAALAWYYQPIHAWIVKTT